MIRLESLADNIDAERDGEWKDPKEWPGLNPERPNEMVPVPGLAFHVRSTNYPDFVTARQEALEELKKDYPDDRIPEDVMARINGKLAAKYLLLGWRGFDLDYSPEAAAEVATAERHRKLRAMIFWCAGLVGKRQVEFITSAAKN